MDPGAKVAKDRHPDEAAGEGVDLGPHVDADAGRKDSWDEDIDSAEISVCKPSCHHPSRYAHSINDNKDGERVRSSSVQFVSRVLTSLSNVSNHPNKQSH